MPRAWQLDLNVGGVCRAKPENNVFVCRISKVGALSLRSYYQRGETSDWN